MGRAKKGIGQIGKAEAVEEAVVAVICRRCKKKIRDALIEVKAKNIVCPHCGACHRPLLWC